MDPLLVITNDEAGTSDDEALEAALDILRGACSVEVQSTSTPRGAGRRPPARGLAADRGRRRRRQPARGHRGPVPPTRPEGRRGRATAHGHRQRLRSHPRDPAGPRGGRQGDRVGRGAPDGPDRRRARRDRGQQRARGRRRTGQPPRRPLEGAPRLGRCRTGEPRQARLPDRRRPRGVPPAERAHARRGGRRGRHRPRPAGADGLGRERRERRRWHRAHPGGRSRGRQGGRDDLPCRRPGRQARLRPVAAPRGAPPPRRRAVPPGYAGDDLRRRVLHLGRR